MIAAPVLFGASPLKRLISLLKSKGGQLYMAGPANNEFLDKSAAAPDGIGTDPIGYARNLAAEELGPQRVPAPYIAANWSLGTGWRVVSGVLIATASPTNVGAYPAVSNPGLDVVRAGTLLETTITVTEITSGYLRLIAGGVGTDITAPGTYKYRGPSAGGAPVYLQAKDSFSGKITLVEVRTVRAAQQTTTAAKPKLVREPILGPELFPYGAGGSTVGWTGNSQRASVTAQAGELVLTATVNDGGAQYAASAEFTVEPGKTYQYSWQARTGTDTSARFAVKRGGGGGYASYQATDFASTAMQQRTGTFIATGADTICQLQFNPIGEVGITATFDNISVREILGYTDRYYWEFDGVDDKLNVITPAGFTADNGNGLLLCCAGTALRASVDSFIGVANAAAGTQIFLLYNNRGVLYGEFRDSLGGVATTEGPVIPLGSTDVITFWNDAGTLRLRKNGVQVASVAAPTGPISLGGRVAEIAGRGASSGVIGNVRIQAPVITAGITTLAEVQQIERAVAAAAGVTLP